MRWFDPRLLYAASKTVLASSKPMGWVLLLVATALYLLYVVLPVFLVPGNDLRFQLDLLHWQDHLLFALLSLVAALLILMQIFLIRRTRRGEQRAAVGRGGVGLWSAVFGGLLASAACSSCIAVLLGFLGAGSVLFIVDHRLHFVAASFAIVFLALLLTAQRIRGYCERCGIPMGAKTP